MSAGRPPKLNPLGQRFRAAYLNPLNSAESICQTMGISSKTFYRYRAELKAPELRFGLLAESKSFNQGKKLGFSTFEEYYGFGIAHSLGQLTGIRYKIVPIKMDQAVNLVARKEVDITCASLCWTADRARSLYSSNPYQTHDRPRGYLMNLKNQTILPRSPQSLRPKLGVLAKSVHEDYALKNLYTEFNIEAFATFAKLFEGIKKGSVGFVLAHPTSVKLAGVDLESRIQINGKPFLYNDTFTTLIFNNESVEYRDPINQALERLFQKDEFAAIQTWSQNQLALVR